MRHNGHVQVSVGCLTMSPEMRWSLPLGSHFGQRGRGVHDPTRADHQHHIAGLWGGGAEGGGGSSAAVGNEMQSFVTLAKGFREG